MPGPLSRDAELDRQADPLAGDPGTWSRTPVRKAVDRMISPSGASMPMASAAFLTRFRTTWISWSRLPSTGGSDGS